MKADSIVMPDDGGGAAFWAPGPELAPIIDRVLRMKEHRELVEAGAIVHWLMRGEPKVKNGRIILGTCYKPQVNGELSSLFDWMLERTFGEFPDFLIILDASYWADATPLQREILVFHELSHAIHADTPDGGKRYDKDGNPVFAIRGHDIEEFNQVAARYGVHSDDLAAFVEAVNQGEAASHLTRIR